MDRRSGRQGAPSPWSSRPLVHEGDEEDCAEEEEESEEGEVDSDKEEDARGVTGEAMDTRGGRLTPDAFEAERRRLQTEDRSFPPRLRQTEDDDTGRPQARSLLGPLGSHPVAGGGYLPYEGGLSDQQSSLFLPYHSPAIPSPPSLLPHPLHLQHHHQTFPAAVYHAGLEGIQSHHHQPSDVYPTAHVVSDRDVAGEESPDSAESTRQFLFRLARKIGQDESEIVPCIIRLEREWLIQKEQLRCLDEETLVARLGIPVPFAQAILEELGVGSPHIPGMIKYKVDQRQPHQPQSQQQPQQQPSQPQPSQKQTQAEGDKSSASKDGSPGGPGRKRKRLTLEEWVSKVEQFALGTNHDPSPFRVASIYQVECYCCGYAVNMNKPGQLYYLKRHVEGVRPDMRISNHFKNYKRWRQQGEGGVEPNLDLSPAKRQKSDADKDEEGAEGESEEGQILGYPIGDGAIRRIRSHSPSQGRRASTERASMDSQPQTTGEPSTSTVSAGASGEGEVEVEGEGNVRLRTLSYGNPLSHSQPLPGTLPHGAPLLSEHMMPTSFHMQLHPIPQHLGAMLPHLQASPHHLPFSQLPPQPTFLHHQIPLHPAYPSQMPPQHLQLHQRHQFMQQSQPYPLGGHHQLLHGPLHLPNYQTHHAQQSSPGFTPQSPGRSAALHHSQPPPERNS